MQGRDLRQLLSLRGTNQPIQPHDRINPRSTELMRRLGLEVIRTDLPQEVLGGDFGEHTSNLDGTTDTPFRLQSQLWTTVTAT